MEVANGDYTAGFRLEVGQRPRFARAKEPGNVEATKVRPFDVGDWSAVERLDRSRYGPDAWSKYFVRIAPVLFGPLSAVAEVNGVLAGYCMAAAEWGASRAWVLALVVSESCEGRGLGRALMEHCLARLDEAQMHEVRLTTVPGNARARGLYERLGFSDESFDPEFVGPGEPRMIMVRRRVAPGP